MSEIEFHFDFGSPNAYLAHRVVPVIEQRTGARFRYVPVLLGGVFKATGNASPMTVALKSKWSAFDLPMWANHYGVPFNRNPFFPVNTLAIMRGAVAARPEARPRDVQRLVVAEDLHAAVRRVADDNPVAVVLHPLHAKQLGVEHGQRVRVGAVDDDAVQGAPEVTPDEELRVEHLADAPALAYHLHGHRVDQERPVVG